MRNDDENLPSGPDTKRIKREICEHFGLPARQVSVRRGRGTGYGWITVRIDADKEVVWAVEEFLEDHAEEFGFFWWWDDFGSRCLELLVSGWDGRRWISDRPRRERPQTPEAGMTDAEWFAILAAIESPGEMLPMSEKLDWMRYGF